MLWPANRPRLPSTIQQQQPRAPCLPIQFVLASNKITCAYIYIYIYFVVAGRSLCAKNCMFPVVFYDRVALPYVWFFYCWKRYNFEHITGYVCMAGRRGQDAQTFRWKRFWWTCITSLSMPFYGGGDRCLPGSVSRPRNWTIMSLQETGIWLSLFRLRGYLWNFQPASIMFERPYGGWSMGGMR